MKKLLLILTAAAVVIFTGCKPAETNQNGEKQIRIGVSIPAASHGWSAGVVWHAEQMKKKLEAENKNVKVLIAASTDAADQVNRIENLLVQNVDALVVMAQEPEPLQQVCERAKKKGKFLVIVSNPLKEPVQDVFVNGDNAGFGSAAAEAMGKELNGKGNIVLKEGYSSPINTTRIEAFRKTLAEKYPDIKILDSRLAYYSAEKALALMENYLQKFKDETIDGVWAGDDDALLGALKACTESHNKTIKTIIGGGGSSKVVKMIMDKNPLVHTTVTYPPAIIKEGIQAAYDGLKDPAKVVAERTVPSEIVNIENAEKYYFPDSNY